MFLISDCYVNILCYLLFLVRHKMLTNNEIKTKIDILIKNSTSPNAKELFSEIIICLSEVLDFPINESLEKIDLILERTLDLDQHFKWLIIKLNHKTFDKNIKEKIIKRIEKIQEFSHKFLTLSVKIIESQVWLIKLI